jgi:deoxyribodipyrimidine photo-lyase
MFSTSYQDILEKIDAIDPIEYGKTRNYIDGAVTKLSPYISRGIISTKQVAEVALKKGFKPYAIDSFLKELAWRDYFQQTWIALGDDIHSDIKQPQPDVCNTVISKSIVDATTSVVAIDTAITELYATGYMHNHIRMYLASITCNIGKSHWKLPAQWMYYHLLDADWASNACSWQWVAGSFSSKKYYANQENINRYSNTHQQNTFLDITYECFETLAIPIQLQQTITLELKTTLPQKQQIIVDNTLPTFLYNFYNLDYLWHENEIGNRVLLLEPSHFKLYPVSPKTIEFIFAMANNIIGIKVYVGEFSELVSENQLTQIYFKEHPTNRHYKGIEENREWMFKDVTGYHPSFFSYWKKCERILKKHY